jgi:CrcB protein
VTWVAVAGAGAAGACCRFLVEHAFRTRGVDTVGTTFPWASYVVNPLGSFALGVVTGLGIAHGLSDDWVDVLGTGFCGAFTVVGPVTFDSLRLAVEGAPAAGVANLVLGVALPLAAAAVGLAASGGLG